MQNLSRPQHDERPTCPGQRIDCPLLLGTQQRIVMPSLHRRQGVTPVTLFPSILDAPCVWRGRTPAFKPEGDAAIAGDTAPHRDADARGESAAPSTRSGSSGAAEVGKSFWRGAEVRC